VVALTVRQVDLAYWDVPVNRFVVEDGLVPDALSR
jgi:hypothetical protein